MMQHGSGPRQPQGPARGEGSAEEAVDRRWPGTLMVLLLALALVWPMAAMAAALVGYLIADREQAIFLFGAAAAILILRWTLLG